MSLSERVGYVSVCHLIVCILTLRVENYYTNYYYYCCTKIKIKLNDTMRRCIEWIWFFFEGVLLKFFSFLLFFFSFQCELDNCRWKSELNLKLAFSSLFLKKIVLVLAIIDDNISHCHPVYYINIEVDGFIFYKLYAI